MKETEIPFGAFDSELQGFEYTIPDGYTAEIVDGKIIVRKEESEDEKIRMEIIRFIKGIVISNVAEEQRCMWLAWLEKQSEQKPVEWSEEDEKMLDIITDYFEWGIDYFFDENDCNKAQDWLKSLKERLQPKQELSENVIVNEYIRDDKLWEK